MSSYTHLTVTAYYAASSPDRLADALTAYRDASGKFGEVEVVGADSDLMPSTVSAVFNHLDVAAALAALKDAVADGTGHGGQPAFVPVAVTEHHENSGDLATHLLDASGNWHSVSTPRM